MSCDIIRLPVNLAEYFLEIEIHFTAAENSVVNKKQFYSFQNSIRQEVKEQKTKYQSEEETDLRKKIRTRDKLFSIIAHDLRSPFSSLISFSEYLSENYNILSQDELGEYSHHLYNSTQNIYNLLENLLQWAKLQTEGIEFAPSNFYLKETVDEILKI